MNIYAERLSQVRFINRNGHDWEPKRAIEKGLVEGHVYLVERTEVGGWHTDVYLVGYGGPFNSVMFEDVKEGESNGNS